MHKHTATHFSAYSIPGLKTRAEILKNPDTIFRLVKKCCEHLKIEEKKLYTRSRKREVTTPRMMIMAALCSKGFTLKSIGNAFAGRDHTTVIHACKTVRDLVQFDDGIKQQSESLRKFLNEIY